MPGDTATPHFLTLIPEIRQTIYKYVFEDSAITCNLKYLKTKIQWGPLFRVNQSYHHNLLLVCEQIYLEADELYQNTTKIALDGTEPWTSKALDRHIGDERLDRVHILATSSGNQLLGTLDLFPNLKAVHVTGEVYCTWNAARRGKDLSDENGDNDDEMKEELKGVIQKRLEPEWTDWNGFGMRGMMRLVDAYPELKVLVEVELKVNHFEGDRVSMYHFEVDFSELKVWVMKDRVEHYHRRDGRHDYPPEADSD